MVLLYVPYVLCDRSPVTGADGIVTGATCSTGAWTGAVVKVAAGGPVSSTAVVTGAMMGVSSVAAGPGTRACQGFGEAQRQGGRNGNLTTQAHSSFFVLFYNTVRYCCFNASK